MLPLPTQVTTTTKVVKISTSVVLLEDVVEIGAQNFGFRVNNTKETMLGIRPSLVAQNFEDFSIFDCNNGDAFAPLPMDCARTEQQSAAINRVFQDSIRLLQHSANSTRVRRDSGFQNQAPTLSSFHPPFASTNTLATTATTDEILEPTNPLEHQRITEVSTLGSTLLQRRYSSAITTNEAVRPSYHSEDHCISPPGHPRDEYSIFRFRPYQTELWEQRFDDLLTYRQRHGHCCVPHTYTQNPSLARWVKRQRYQYKLKTQGKESTMTNRRAQALEQVGFIWDSHNATWEERLNELKVYRRIHGHCEVPTHYQQNKKLATWVKCQRRQYKLYRDGKQSTMTPERLDELHQLNFSWEMMPRCPSK